MATRGSGLPGGSLTLDQLIGLNDEMVALVRAGIPLERGLIQAGRDLQGRLGSIVGDLGERLGQGEALPDALAHSKRRVPAIYRAVVEAGMRSGRLPEALEGMATLSRNYAEMRRSIGVALLYPLVVLELAYGLALVFLLQIGPRFAQTFEVMGLPPIPALDFLIGLGGSAKYWGPIPAMVPLAILFLWIGAGRSSSLDPGFVGRLIHRLPVVGPLLRDFQAAQFADLLALLIAHETPLDEAVTLAAEASGTPSYVQASEVLCRVLREGRDPSAPEVLSLRAFPPLLAWILSATRVGGDRASALRHVASTYRRRAENRADFLRTSLPTFMTIAIGAGSVALYGLLLFIPLSQLLNGLAIPINQ